MKVKILKEVAYFRVLVHPVDNNGEVYTVYAEGSYDEA